MSKPDGGMAFPIQGEWPNPIEPGMTLRDYLAAAALTGTIAYYGRIAGSQSLVATEAYAIADLMLAEREKSGD